ncbi:PDZ domain-containing protein [uncultured Rubinisphaera sp.]|uniref:PDZ domain-containing protein n=1 Tax=uncultured Rubinisphaera sp. TaxID=1678686 RepID=UPI0030D99030
MKIFPLNSLMKCEAEIGDAITFRKKFLSLCGVLCLLLNLNSPIQAAPFPGENAESIITQAMLQSSPSLVRIETVGGADVVDEVLTGTGPTTGVILSEDGYIITSSFNFASNPATVLVTLPETDNRLPAQIVARDEVRKTTLLKIEATGLIPAVAVPVEDIKVGQWVLALGRTYDARRPNVSLGLVSALGRVEGKAIQTDAKVSPANYGGPLTNLKGEVLGILTPLSPQGSSSMDGMNWYDSGIGFAIPLQDIYVVLDRLKAGETLKPGLMGVSFSATPGFLTDPVIKEVRPASPAAEAGLKAEDRVMSAEGKEVKSVAQLKQVVGQKYAGDPFSMTVSRGDSTEEVTMVLAAELQTFEHGLLGILPKRVMTEESGVAIRTVLADSAAGKAGILNSDVIVSLNGEEIQNVVELSLKLSVKPAGEEVTLGLLREGETQSQQVTLATANETIPAEVPLPFAGSEPDEALKLKESGDLKKTVSETSLDYEIYIPEDCQSDRRYGLILWMSSQGDRLPAEELAEWKRICRTRGFILVRPLTEPGVAWTAADTLALESCLDDVEQKYSIDRDTTVMFVTGNQPTFLLEFATTHRSRIHGIVIQSIPRQFDLPFNEPGQRFRFALLHTADLSEEIQNKLKDFAKNHGIPAWISQIQPTPTQEEFDNIATWFDLLGTL